MKKHQLAESGNGIKELVAECLYISCSLSRLHKPVDGPEEGDVLDGSFNGREHNQHEDKGGAGHAGRGDGGGGRGQHDGHQDAGVQGDVVHLGDEDRGDRDEEGGAVHVDRGPDREHELGDPGVDLVVLLHAAEGHRESSGSANDGGKCLMSLRRLIPKSSRRGRQK